MSVAGMFCGWQEVRRSCQAGRGRGGGRCVPEPEGTARLGAIEPVPPRSAWLSEAAGISSTLRSLSSWRPTACSQVG